MQSSNEHERRLAAFLAALAFFLSTIEYMLPRPVPFMRLGLSNLPLLLGVDLLSPGYFALLALAKVVGMSLFSGSLFSYVALFSLAGTAASALCMKLLRMILGERHLSYLGLCIAGAMASNACQVLLARVFVFGPSARYMIPAFLGLGLVSGAVLGLFTQVFVAQSAWYTRVREDAYGKR